jgi:dTDP-4-dehydro-6-deoxy-alpha-D-glucopyranose 2,3-dehydratase
MNSKVLFLKSLLTQENPINSTSEALAWLKERNETVKVDIQTTAFSKLDQWMFDEEKGNLRHVSGKFFSIDGIRTKTNYGLVSEWEQPIINQPEVGILGIITREINGVLYFLMQAKIEPGNINKVQLSPTLQATRSNYTQVHKGNKPQFLEYFLDPAKEVLLDQLQSEQGSRFLRKRNRNIIIKVKDAIPDHENFRWLTLGQIVALMRHPNLVNMDSRTVISGIPYDAADGINIAGLFSGTNDIGYKLYTSNILEKDPDNFERVLSWVTELKSQYELWVERIPLRSVHKWIISDDSIHHEDNKYFSVIPVRVSIGNREVKHWDQPLLKPAQEGLCAFIVKEIAGKLHFLVQAKLECGNLDIIELAPTVQCLTGNYRTAVEKPPFLDYVLNADKSNVIYDVCQSEEGGRFFEEQNRNMMILADDSFDQKVPANYTWLTLGQMKYLIRFNNFLNIQARSLISSIQFN